MPLHRAFDIRLSLHCTSINIVITKSSVPILQSPFALSPLSLSSFAPFDAAVVDAVQVFTVDVPPAAPVATKNPAITRLGPSDSLPPSRSEAEVDDALPREINRWQQLRQMVHTLTGLMVESEAESTTDTRVPGRRRRSRRSLGGHSPILLLHYDFWLEAIDEKHRYGFHLRAFHELWKQEMADASPVNDADRSFFYWLDHGNGSHIELPHCDRNALNTTRVQYCSVPQRRQFEVEFNSTQLTYAESHVPVQTDALSKWIFVLSQDDRLYVARKRKGYFHHSSFLGGVPVVAAGKIFVTDGKVYAIEPHSGHFKPRLESVTAVCSVLEAHGVDSHRVHFIKPRKWKDPWPFSDAPHETLEEADILSDSEDSGE